MTDLAVSFGNSPTLVGVVSEPETVLSGSPTVIILNSGLLHKVGPFRLSVTLARRLAVIGYRVLRMDISGIGDSKMRVVRDSTHKALLDVDYAMNFMSKDFGSQKFVLMGLCSGADNAHRTAVADERVVGTVNLDGYCATNFMYTLHYYGERFLSWKFISSKLQRFTAVQKNTTPSDKSKEVFDPNADALLRSFPSRKQMGIEFSQLISRNVKMLYVYTRGVEYYCNYANQLFDILKPNKIRECVDVQLYPYDDHTWSRTEARKKLINSICLWMQKTFHQL
ncbi:hypothetical protein [Teredinibacter franksiae]|uniref:hypothetical protein n=1 Tax=Teredinibacter franksiae TaxID=2761453 RepID=UPI00162538AD|nr:hypothetical protein [Teredinibacter franksiae]